MNICPVVSVVVVAVVYTWAVSIYHMKRLAEWWRKACVGLLLVATLFPVTLLLNGAFGWWISDVTDGTLLLITFAIISIAGLIRGIFGGGK